MRFPYNAVDDFLGMVKSEFIIARFAYNTERTHRVLRGSTVRYFSDVRYSKSIGGINTKRSEAIVVRNIINSM